AARPDAGDGAQGGLGPPAGLQPGPRPDGAGGPRGAGAAPGDQLQRRPASPERLRRRTPHRPGQGTRGTHGPPPPHSRTLPPAVASSLATSPATATTPPSPAPSSARASPTACSPSPASRPEPVGAPDVGTKVSAIHSRPRLSSFVFDLHTFHDADVTLRAGA